LSLFDKLGLHLFLQRNSFTKGDQAGYVQIFKPLNSKIADFADKKNKEKQ
jgi:hypothetical protein